MSFHLPTVNNLHDVDPNGGTQPRFLSLNAGSIAATSVGLKDLGNLPLSQGAGQFRNDGNFDDTAGLGYEFQASQVGYDVSTDTKVLLWHSQFNAANRIQTTDVAGGGCIIRLYTGNGSMPTIYREWIVGGNDTPNAASVSGQYPYTIDLNDSSYNNSNGTWDNTDATSYAYLITYEPITGTNYSWQYMGSCFILDTTKISSNTPTFLGTSEPEDAVLLIQGTDYTDKLGNWVRQNGSVIFIDMGFRIGDGSTTTNFNDNGLTIISPLSNDSADPRVRVTTQAFRTYLNLPNHATNGTATFSGTWVWQTRALFDWNQNDSAVVTFNGVNFNGMGEFTLGSSIIGNGNWDNVDAVILADTGVDIDGSTFKNPNGDHLLNLTSGAMDITDMRFESYASNHAILIDTAGTYNFDNVFFDQTGTNDIETTHGSGTVTINITNGGTVPTITETGAGAVVVNNNVPVRMTVFNTSATPIENAMVYITATEAVGTIAIDDVILSGLTDSSGVTTTTTFNYEAAFNPTGLDVKVKVRQGTVSPFMKTNITSDTISTIGITRNVILIKDE